MFPLVDVFISYSSADRPIAEDLSRLLSQAYDEVWLDRNLVGGDEWWAEILDKISQCSHFIYLISRDSLESDWCEKELQEAQGLGKHIIPVIVRARTEIPEDLSKRQIIDMSGGITVESLDQLYAALIRASKDRVIEENDEKRRSADLELLQRLWPLISTQNMVRLDDETQSHYIDRQFYIETVRAYLLLRDLRDNPQNAFFDSNLEAGFQSVDEALRAYNAQKTLAFSGESIDGRMVFISSYQACKRAWFGVTEETISQKLGEYNRTVDLILQVRERHNELVNIIRSRYPDFKFRSDHYEDE